MNNMQAKNLKFLYIIVDLTVIKAKEALLNSPTPLEVHPLGLVQAQPPELYLVSYFSLD